MNTHINVLFYAGLILIMLGVVIVFFPPKVGNFAFGPQIKTPIIGKKIWKTAQQLNAFLYILLGSFSVLISYYETSKHTLIILLALIACYKIGNWLINSIIRRKIQMEKTNK